MKIVGVCSKGYSFPAAGRPVLTGGAQITHLTFLRALAGRRGHQCELFVRFPVRRDAGDGPVRISSFRDLCELRSKLEQARPDVLLVALGVSSDAARIGHHLGVPSLLQHHAYECCPPTPNQKRQWGLASEDDWLSPAQIEFLERHAARSVACSSFLRDFIRRRGGICHQTIYPEFDPDRIRARKPGGNAVTAVCGHAYKGAEILLALARRFPKQVFRLAGNVDPGLRAAFGALDNVRLTGPLPPYELFEETAVALMPSQWPEPFGRFAVEAMINRIPVLASAVGGLLEAAGARELQVRQYHSADAWESKLGELLSQAAARKANLEQGMLLARRFTNGRATEMLERELRRAAGGSKWRSRPDRIVALCGETSAKTAFALVNTNWSKVRARGSGTRFLQLRNPMELSPVPVDVFIQHDYQQNFAELSLPEEGKVVAVRTWDFGPFPPVWVEKINHECDQLWVHTAWIRENAIRGGVDPNKVFVVPLGFDEMTFRPRGPVRRLPTRKSFRFLFVGKTVIRKGVDILLKAYTAAFGPEDDVVLVIKDNPRDVFYKGIDLRDEIVRLARRPKTPEILYVDDFLTQPGLASLYRACDAGVFPYRAEGFCLPILEAMGCGIPCIVPNFGAALDFCGPHNSFPVSARRIQLPVTGSFAINTLGFEAEVREVDFCEVPVDGLAAQMRAVYDGHREAIAEKGRKAAFTARNRFTWKNSVDAMRTPLEKLRAKSAPIRLIRRRKLAREKEWVMEVARGLYLDRMTRESG